jgi:hypothetical protein
MLNWFAPEPNETTAAWQQLPSVSSEYAARNKPVKKVFIGILLSQKRMNETTHAPTLVDEKKT